MSNSNYAKGAAYLAIAVLGGMVASLFRLDAFTGGEGKQLKDETDIALIIMEEKLKQAIKDSEERIRLYIARSHEETNRRFEESQQADRDQTDRFDRHVDDRKNRDFKHD